MPFDPDRVKHNPAPPPPSGPSMPAVPGSGRNYARTAVLMAALVGLLAMGGALAGGPRGMLLFGGIGLVFNFLSYWFSDKIALAMNGARAVTQAEQPELYAIVEKLTRRAGLPMPAIYVIPTDTPNAFATGRNPEHAAVAVTEGIMRLLDRRQLEGVLAHELSHVANRDILIATMAAMIAGLISGVGYMMRWGAILGGQRGDREGGPSGLELLAWAILAPIIALLLQLAVSRSREYGADATGAALVGDPEPLAQALLKLEHGNDVLPYDRAGPATAHLFIVNPLRGGAAKLMSLFSTHPPIEERVARLRALRGAPRYA
ncbi:MAG TPA: zinc metalloprotease HtpX [Anaeromyxobacteraceae bacterium]|nr:zinc metalloprotease HtpX [Anaeromyxobacteraceae bacterium]